MKNAIITTAMPAAEFSALMVMAEKECREPREQIRFLIRKAARDEGLLSPDDERLDTETKRSEGQHDYAA